jgi:hypothetical protein
MVGEYWHTKRNTVVCVDFGDDDTSTDLYISWTEGDSDLHSDRITPEQVERMIARGILMPTNEPDHNGEGR